MITYLFFKISVHALSYYQEWQIAISWDNYSQRRFWKNKAISPPSLSPTRPRRTWPADLIDTGRCWWWCESLSDGKLVDIDAEEHLIAQNKWRRKSRLQWSRYPSSARRSNDSVGTTEAEHLSESVSIRFRWEWSFSEPITDWKIKIGPTTSTALGGGSFHT